MIVKYVIKRHNSKLDRLFLEIHVFLGHENIISCFLVDSFHIQLPIHTIPW